MKNKLLFCLFALLISFSLSATHMYSGYISYEKTNTTTNEYKITLTTYTDSRSIPAHRAEYEIKLGYGSPSNEKTLILNSVDGSTQQVVGDYLWKNVYSGVHEFPTNQNSFTLSVTEPNMASSVLNVNNGTSVNVPVVFKTVLYNNKNAHSPIFDSLLVKYTSPGQFINFSGGIKDLDNDNIVFELISEDDNYVYPSKIGNGQQTFKAENTQLIWNKPIREGRFLAKLRVIEYDDGNTNLVLSKTEVYISIFSIKSTASSINEPAKTNFIEQQGNNLIYKGDNNNNQLMIYNLCGQCVFKTNNLTSFKSIALPQQKGVYIVHFKNSLHEETQKVSVY